MVRAQAASISGKQPFGAFDYVLIEPEAADIEALLKLSTGDLVKKFSLSSSCKPQTKVCLITAQPDGSGTAQIHVISAALGIADVISRIESLQVPFPPSGVNQAET